jgi:hypothetical protein
MAAVAHLFFGGRTSATGFRGTLVYGALTVVSSPLFFIHSRLTEPACGACKPEILAPVVPGLVPGRFFGHGVFLVYHRDRLGVTSHTGPL